MHDPDATQDWRTIVTSPEAAETADPHSTLTLAEAARHSDDAPRLTPDRYRIDAEVGGGAMGIVYPAFDLRLQRPIALKVLCRSLSQAISAQRWLVAKIVSPYVVAVHDFGVLDDGRTAICLDWVDGATYCRFSIVKAARCRKSGRCVGCARRRKRCRPRNR
ncbi:MAG: hypothetical protein QM811_29185 [Pirellulales bacterium]